MTGNRNYFELETNGSAHGKDVWRYYGASLFRLTCEFAPKQWVGSSLRTWSLGEPQLLDGQFAHWSAQPMRGEADAWLFIKLIVSGAMDVEQDGRRQRFGPGSMVLIDAARPYRQSFGEPTHMVALRFPRHCLKQRGFSDDLLRRFVAPDPTAPDVRAVSETMLALAAQNGETSDSLRCRQGTQLLDLIDLLLDDPVALARARSGAATLFRAKRFIGQNLRNPDLTAPLIADAVCVSDAHLSRLFRADGESLMRYVWQRRLELAAELLRRGGTGGPQIREIAFRCGFSTPAHFSRVFKERYGVTPREASLCGLGEAAEAGDRAVRDTGCPSSSEV
jgi:AraC-like DNA-binding protein